MKPHKHTVLHACNTHVHSCTRCIHALRQYHVHTQWSNCGECKIVMLSFALQFAVKIAKAFDCLEYAQEKEVCQCALFDIVNVS